MRYIERGWESYRNMVVPKDASEKQVEDARRAFYSGAAILFTGLMTTLDPGDEPTESDMNKMSDIQEELNAFGQELDRYILQITQH